MLNKEQLEVLKKCTKNEQSCSDCIFKNECNGENWIINLLINNTIELHKDIEKIMKSYESLNNQFNKANSTIRKYLNQSKNEKI